MAAVPGPWLHDAVDIWPRDQDSTDLLGLASLRRSPNPSTPPRPRPALALHARRYPALTLQHQVLLLQQLLAVTAVALLQGMQALLDARRRLPQEQALQEQWRWREQGVLRRHCRERVVLDRRWWRHLVGVIHVAAAARIPLVSIGARPPRRKLACVAAARERRIGRRPPRPLPGHAVRGLRRLGLFQAIRRTLQISP